MSFTHFCPGWRNRLFLQAKAALAGVLGRFLGGVRIKISSASGCQTENQIATMQGILGGRPAVPKSASLCMYCQSVPVCDDIGIPHASVGGTTRCAVPSAGSEGRFRTECTSRSLLAKGTPWALACCSYRSSCQSTGFLPVPHGSSVSCLADACSAPVRTGCSED